MNLSLDYDVIAWLNERAKTEGKPISWVANAILRSAAGLDAKAEFGT